VTRAQRAAGSFPSPPSVTGIACAHSSGGLWGISSPVLKQHLSLPVLGEKIFQGGRALSRAIPASLVSRGRLQPSAVQPEQRSLWGPSAAVPSQLAKASSPPGCSSEHHLCLSPAPRAALVRERANNKINHPSRWTFKPGCRACSGGSEFSTQPGNSAV